MGLTLSDTRSGVFGDLKYYIATATFDSSYPLGGEALTKANMGLSDVLFVQSVLRGAGNNGRAFYNETAEKLQLFAQIAGLAVAIDGETAQVGLINDDDSAASNGVQVYAVVDSDPGIPGAARGHFEFVSPTDASGRGEYDATYKGQYTIRDADAAATNGTAVRAIAAAGGLESTFASALGAGGPLYIAAEGTGTGHANINFENVFFKVSESTTASTPNVYFDEDAAEESERLLAVVVDNMDETYGLFTVLSNGEVPAGTNCAAAVVDILAIGTP